MGKSLRGQSAMEYLMTYGWALLVIVIVVAVLLWINPFKAPEQCLFDQAGFTCAGQRLVANYTTGLSNVIFADITNGNQKAVRLVGIACVLGRSSPPARWWDDAQYAPRFGVSKTVEYQGTFNLGIYPDDLSAAKNTICYKNWTGGNLVPATNQDFNGRLYLAYKFTDEPDAIPPKIVGANLVMKSQ